MAAITVLMAIGSDEIYSLDKRFADPRAPKEKPTQEQMEEGILPYRRHSTILATVLVCQKPCMTDIYLHLKGKGSGI